MFVAINSKTNQRVNSLAIEVDPSYLLYKEDIWFADPLDIKEYDKTKIDDISKIEVKFRKGSSNKLSINGNFFDVLPHFYIPNKESLGIITEPESKEHKLAKLFIYKLAKEDKLKFIYSTYGKSETYNNTLILNSDLVDFNKIDIEEPIKNNRRQVTDIFIPFKKRDDLFGDGICIEIQFSKQFKSTTENRSVNLAIKGYSVCWLWDYDIFVKDTNEVIINSNLLKLETMSGMIKKFHKEARRNMLWITEDNSRKIDKKISYFNNILTDKINYILSEIERVEKPITTGFCPKCKIGLVLKRKNKKNNSIFYGCSNYPSCNFSVSIK